MKKAQVSKVLDSILKSKPGPGIDNINVGCIKRNKLQKQYIDIAYQVLRGKKDFSFSKYKQILKVKGREKYPRVISVPTIRDRLILKCVHDEHLNIIKRPKFNEIISNINLYLVSHKFDSYISFDISKFYDSIDIDILLKKLKDEKINKNIIDIIEKAVLTGTFEQSTNRKVFGKTKIERTGVPQGIIISNALGELYLKDFDQYFNKKKTIKFFRFVDDIIILFDSKIDNKKDLENEIKFKLSEILLHLNETKTKSGPTTEEISFLGYVFLENKITVKKETIYAKEKQIERLVFDTIRAKNKKVKCNMDLLLWKLNNNIAGFVSGEKIYGWVQVYRLVNDETIFYKLDATLRKIFKRAGVKMPDGLKHFSKAHYYLSKGDISYSINFDKLYHTTTQKRDLLIKLFSISKGTKAVVVNDLFRMLVTKTIYDAEKDLDFKYEIH